jgi:hypothetical protein
MGQLLQARVAQAKLAISQPGDPYEQEADRIADQVMRMPDSGADDVQVTPTRLVQRTSHPAAESSTADDSLASSIGSLPQGEPLSRSVRSDLESRFGADFSAVRVHTGAHAHALAQSVQAKAFTVGNDIVFGAGHYAPETNQGRHLLAHELTHTLQQRGSAPQIARAPDEPVDPHAQWELEGWKKALGLPTGENRIARAIRISVNQQYIDEYNANAPDPEAHLALDENGEIVSRPSGFIQMIAGDDELRTWLRARNHPLQPRALEVAEALQERIQQDSFDLATGHLQGAQAAAAQAAIERNRALLDHLRENVLAEEVNVARHQIREHRAAHVERLEQIAAITGRSFADVVRNRPRGFGRSALDSAEEPFLVVGDSVRLAFDGKARPLSKYGQSVKIAAEVYGEDPWETIVPRQIAGSVPILGQTLGVADLAESIGKGQFNWDMAGSMAGGVALSLAMGKLTLGSGLVKVSGPSSFGTMFRSLFGRRLYDSLDEAAFAALSKYNPRSIRRNLEYGGLLYETRGGRYGFSRARKGKVDAVNPFEARIPRNTRPVADYHTHGDYGRAVTNWRGRERRVRTSAALDEYKSDLFSGQDITDLMFRSSPGRSPGFKSYLGTPSGHFLTLEFEHPPFPADPIEKFGWLDPQLFLGDAP